MFFYDWKKMFVESSGSANDCMAIFRMLVTNEVPKNKYDPIYRFYEKNFNGSSFLVHEDVLLHNAWKHNNKDLCQYLALASLRPYSEYLIAGTTTLDFKELPFDPFDLIEDARLLYLKDGQLHFLYEEVPTEKLQWH